MAKYLMFSLEGEESKQIGEILGNENCKKILNLLAEKELSESDIAKELGMKVNTIEYNLRKLISLGLVKKVSHFWSSKGKKIPVYQATNKHIVISPRTKARGFLITGILAIIVAFIIKIYSSSKEVMRVDKAEMLEKAAETSLRSRESQIWVWFLIGALFVLVVLYFLRKLSKSQL